MIVLVIAISRNTDGTIWRAAEGLGVGASWGGGVAARIRTVVREGLRDG